MIQIKGGDVKHFPGSFTIVSCDQWRVDIDKIVFLKKFVYGICSQRADPEYGLKCIGARTQMRNRAQIFQRMSLFLKRIIGTGGAFDSDPAGMQLKRLFGVRCCNKATGNNERSTNIQMADLLQII